MEVEDLAAKVSPATSLDHSAGAIELVIARVSVSLEMSGKFSEFARRMLPVRSGVNRYQTIGGVSAPAFRSSTT